MADSTIPTRNQIARLVGNDPAMIKALERLFIVANDITPTEISTLTQLITDNSYATGAASNFAEAQIFEIQKQIAAVSSRWSYFATQWTTIPALVGTATVSGQAGSVYSYSFDITRYRFVPTAYSAILDGFYTAYVVGVLSGLVCVRGI